MDFVNYQKCGTFYVFTVLFAGTVVKTVYHGSSDGYEDLKKIHTKSEIFEF